MYKEVKLSSFDDFSAKHTPSATLSKKQPRSKS